MLIHHPPLPGLSSWRKTLTDAKALAALLRQHGAELVLHGHLHRNTRQVCAGGLRVYGTAAASSTMESAPAAYRRFDIEAIGSGWDVHMALKTVVPERAALTIAQDRWHAPCPTPGANRA